MICGVVLGRIAIAGEHEIEGGGIYYDLTDGFESTSGEYFSARIESSPINSWVIDVTSLDRFGDDGTQYSLANTHIFSDRTFTRFSIASSSDGFFWPRLRVDGSLRHKWFEDKSLVTTVGEGYCDAKDAHEDKWGYVEASYYFRSPFVLQGGMQVNVSDPGSVSSTSGWIAATYLRNEIRIMSLRVGANNDRRWFVGRIEFRR